MIYSFPKHDQRQQALLELLRRRGIDYDLVEQDQSVVLVLGVVDDGIRSELEAIVATAPKVTIKRAAEDDCYAAFLDRSALPLIAGPCAVENEAQIAAIVEFLASHGVRYLRGGAYKPRTSCDSFQGLGRPGLELLRRYADQAGMYVVTEVMDRSQVDTVVEFADILQVGSRNMFNYTLLTTLGAIAKPVLLKRGMAATISEWLDSAEYIRRGGNEQVILCERGIRTFEPQTSHTLDLAAIHLARSQSGLPVIADSSHACGRADLVIPLAAAAVAAGADGIMVEIHPEPRLALSDGKQALTFAQFEELRERVQRIHRASLK
jgi:3-deoxy-7-phosphoheptulonate synthase